MYNNFEILLVVFMPNSTTNQVIPYTNTNQAILKFPWVAFKDLDATEPLIQSAGSVTYAKSVSSESVLWLIIGLVMNNL